MKTLLALTLAAMPLFAGAQYKCTGPDGKVTYQDKPCAAGSSGTTLNIKAPPPAQAASPEMAGAAELRKAINLGILRNEPIIGMNMLELERALGKPTKINAANYGQGVEEQRIYERGARSWYVYTSEGRVRSIQNSENASGYAAAAAQPVAKSANCPSQTEIANVETSLSSKFLKDHERESLEKKLQWMRECR